MQKNENKYFCNESLSVEKMRVSNFEYRKKKKLLLNLD